MSKNIKSHLIPRNGTAATWELINPVLLKGEMGVESDTRRFKFGDGVTPWNNLAYAGGQSSIGDLEIGGRNLLLGSTSNVYSPEYKFANYYLSEAIQAGKEVTLTVWGELDDSVDYVTPYNSGGILALISPDEARKYIRSIKETGKGSVTFLWKTEKPGYDIPNDSLAMWSFNADGSANTAWKNIHRIKLEYGNISTDWCPAPEDLQGSGINMMGGSSMGSMPSGWNHNNDGASFEHYQGYNCLKCTKYGSGAYGHIHDDEFEDGELVTVSAWVYSTAAGARIYMGYENSSLTTYIAEADKWVRISLSQKIPSSRICSFYKMDNEANIVAFRNIKIERGSGPTDWSPAPEDATAGGGSLPFKVITLNFNGAARLPLTDSMLHELREASMLVVENSLYNNGTTFHNVAMPIIMLHAYNDEYGFYQYVGGQFPILYTSIATSGGNKLLWLDQDTYSATSATTLEESEAVDTMAEEASAAKSAPLEGQLQQTENSEL